MSSPETTVCAAPARDTEARCPKCRSRDFEVSYIDAVEQTNGVRDGRWDGVFHDSAMPDRISAHGKCVKCNHKWRFRRGWID